MKSVHPNNRGSAALQCGKALPFRALHPVNVFARLSLATRRSSFRDSSNRPTVRHRLTALESGKAATALTLVLIIFTTGSFAQTTRPAKTGAHSSSSREAYTAADRRLVERAIGVTC